MNKNRKYLLIIACIAVLIALFATGCSSSSNEGDKFIMGGTYRLAENETINGNLSVFGGAVSLEKGSSVNGDVTLIGGTINAAGTINGGINGLGGSITLGDTAIVYGDVTTVGANVNKSDSAIVQGKVVSQSQNGVEIPDVPKVVVPAIIKPFNDVFGALLRSLVIALLAVLVTLFLPRHAENISRSIEDSPVSGGAIGLLTWILFPFVIIILAITIILIPLSVIAILMFGLGVLLGWIAIGMLLGERIAGMFKSQWAPAVNAGVGTFILSILSSLFGAIPCVGWVIPLLIILVATGGIVMSAFGTRFINTSNKRPTISVINPNPVPPASYSPPAPSAPVSTIVDSSFVAPLVETPAASEDKKSEGSPAAPEKRSVLKNRKTKIETDTDQDNN